MTTEDGEQRTYLSNLCLRDGQIYPLDNTDTLVSASTISVLAMTISVSVSLFAKNIDFGFNQYWP